MAETDGPWPEQVQVRGEPLQLPHRPLFSTASTAIPNLSGVGPQAELGLAKRVELGVDVLLDRVRQPPTPLQVIMIRILILGLAQLVFHRPIELDEASHPLAHLRREQDRK